MTAKTKIRPIVKAAFKIDALEHQFAVLDVEDGCIKASDYDGIVAEVNEEYSDNQIIGDAENQLDIVEDNLRDYLDSDDLKVYRREARQLRAFLKRFKKAAA